MRHSTVLPDGDWGRVLDIVVHGRPDIEVVLSSRLGDHKLWIDVLEQGASGVLGNCLDARTRNPVRTESAVSLLRRQAGHQIAFRLRVENRSPQGHVTSRVTRQSHSDGLCIG
jgi:hypothetical protein